MNIVRLSAKLSVIGALVLFAACAQKSAQVSADATAPKPIATVNGQSVFNGTLTAIYPTQKRIILP